MLQLSQHAILPPLKHACASKVGEESNDVFVDGGRARSGSTLSTLSHLYPETRARSGSILSRLSKQDTEGDATSARSGSDAATAAHAARTAALKSEIDSLKKQVASLQHDKEEADEARALAEKKLEESEAEGDTQLALIAKLKEQVTEKLGGATAGADTSTDADAGTGADADADAGALKDFQAYVQHLRTKFEEDVSGLQAQLATTKQQLAQVNQEYEQKQAEWTRVAETLMSSSKGASIMEGNADLSIVLEEHQLYKEENDELRGMLEDALLQVDSLGSRLKSHKEAQEFLEQNLADLEDENQRLQDQVSSTHASQRSVTTRESHIRELRAEVEEMQGKAEASQAHLEQLQQEADSSKAALEDAQQQLTEALNARHAVDEEVDALKQKLQDKEEELTRVRANLAEASDEAARARAECETAQTQSTQARALAEQHAAQAQRAADSEVQAALTSAEEYEREVRQLKVELKDSRDTCEKQQYEMESILTTVRKELVESQGNAETAALAGLSLKELVDQLKDDKLRATGERDEAVQRLAEVEQRLEEREALLTQVMEHLQSVGGGQGEGEGADADALNSLSHRLERAKQEHDDMQSMMTQMEEEADKLQQQVKDLEGERKDLCRSKQELDDALTETKHDLETVTAKLEEREAMLAKVMAFLKSARDGDDTDEGSDGAEGEGSGDAGFSAKGLDALVEQLQAAERERERLRRAKAEADAQLKTSASELATAKQALQDEEDARAAAAEQLAQAERRADALEGRVGELEASQASLEAKLKDAEARETALAAELKAKSDELDAIRAELEGANANMRAAAEAGLSLTEMLNKLKEEHAARVAELEAELQQLRDKVAEYERILRGVKDMLEQQKDGDQGDGVVVDGDVIAQLKRRLELGEAEREELERTLTEMETELASKNAEIERLKEELEASKLKISQLEVCACACM